MCFAGFFFSMTRKVRISLQINAKSSGPSTWNMGCMYKRPMLTIIKGLLVVCVVYHVCVCAYPKLDRYEISYHKLEHYKIQNDNSLLLYNTTVLSNHHWGSCNCYGFHETWHKANLQISNSNRFDHLLLLFLYQYMWTLYWFYRSNNYLKLNVVQYTYKLYKLY